MTLSYVDPHSVLRSAIRDYPGQDALHEKSFQYGDTFADEGDNEGCMSALLAIVLLCGQTSPTTGADTATFDLYGDPLPVGAVSRLGSGRFRQHGGRDGQAGIVLVDDQLIALTSHAELVYYEVPSGKVTRLVALAKPRKEQGEGETERESVRAIASTRDRQRLAMYSFVFLPQEARYRHFLRVVDLRTAKPIAEFDFEESSAEIRVIAISPDGASVVSAAGAEVRIWDIASGVEVLRHQIEQRASIRSLAFSNDSKRLIIGADNALYRWVWASPEMPRKIELGPANKRLSPVSIDFSGNDELIAVGLERDPGILLFDADCKALGELSENGETHLYVRSVRFSPDGNLLAAAEYRGGVWLWDVATRRLRRKLPSITDDYTQLSFSPDGSRLAAASTWSGTMDVFDVETGHRLASERPAHEQSPNFLAFLDNAERMASASDDGSLCVWQTRTGELLRVFRHESRKGHSSWIRAAAVSPDGKYAASSSLDDTVRLWNLQTGEQVYRLAGHGRLGGRRALAFTGDSRHVASWGDDMQVYLWEVATGKAVVEYRLGPSGITIPESGSIGDPFSNGFQLGAGTFLPGGDRLAVHINAHIYIFETRTGKELAKHVIDPGLVVSLVISPDSQLIATSQWGKGVQTKLANGRTRSSSAKDHPIALRRLDDGAVVERTVLPDGGAGPLAFSPDGKLLVSGNSEPSPHVRIYRLDPMREVGRIDIPDSRPLALAVSTDNRFLATSLGNMNVMIWDLASQLNKGPTPR